MMRRLRVPGFVLLSVLIFGGCSKPSEEPAPPPDESAAHAGKTIFQTRCFVCHGREGKGDGPASTGLGAAVRDLTNPAWQDSISDETIGKVIRSGAAAVGGTAAMAPNPDLSDAQIYSLTLYIRSLRGQ